MVEEQALSSTEGNPGSAQSDQDSSLTENFKLIISYDGTEYHGWQRQPGKITIQALIENALQRLTGQVIKLQAAGRTDAGVHAIGQVASFRAVSRLKESELLRALNALLPPDIRIMEVARVARDFQARKSAHSKIYRYRIKTSVILSPFDYRYVFHYPHPLNKEAMSLAARCFERQDDFTAFSSGFYQHPVRHVYHSVLEAADEELVFTIEANGFLRHMVRTIVGTLLMVGRNRLAPEGIEELFKGKKRTRLSPTAPARGLYLVKVIY
ncbi:MAG TPA: tRNA pseudouridine(38-40) synthase TruA [Candidatus Saccharicenans sp.]|nr:tRNA pseudouridine(38-40) synthase TruA [Candidatus Saccharicenans sp.]